MATTRAMLAAVGFTPPTVAMKVREKTITTPMRIRKRMMRMRSPRDVFSVRAMRSATAFMARRSGPSQWRRPPRPRGSPG